MAAVSLSDGVQVEGGERFLSFLISVDLPLANVEWMILFLGPATASVSALVRFRIRGN
jgi:hypothetical protein